MQVALEPLDRGQVKIIRRLVEQQDARPGNQGAREFSAHLPPAAEGAKRAGQRLGGETETAKGGLRAMAQVIAAAVLKGRLQLAEAVEIFALLFGIAIGERVGDRINLALHLLNFAHGIFGVFEDGAFNAVRIELLALTRLLQHFGPQLGRPRVDTLNGSRHANMKELRFSAADGVWGVAFAFDTKRKAILLVAGDKSGVGERRFYRELIRKADDRFDAHLARLKKERG